MNKKLMRTQEEVGTMDYRSPYYYSVERDDRCIYYFGAAHTRDPQHPQFQELKKFWEEFLSKTAGRERIAFVEGSIRESSATDESEAILKDGGEGGWLTFHAAHAGVSVHCPEPSLEQEVTELLKQFSREQVQYYYFARVVNQWHRTYKEVPFQGYIERHLRQDKKEMRWEDFDFSLEHMKQIHREIFGADFDEHDARLFYDASNPTKITNPVSTVARASSDIRNAYILDQIQEYWDKGFSIFIVYGSGHAVIHEPVIRTV